MNKVRCKFLFTMQVEDAAFKANSIGYITEKKALELEGLGLLEILDRPEPKTKTRRKRQTKKVNIEDLATPEGDN